MTTHHTFKDMDQRAHAVFRYIVESFMEDGSPIGSRTLSKKIPGSLSPATIRNVMSDLEDAGLIKSPHTSAGRLPTDSGLRLFVDGILEKGALTDIERAALEEECNSQNLSIDKVFEQASSTLSGLSASAGLVVTPAQAEKTIRHIEFVSLSSEQAMVVLVFEDGSVENRMITMAENTTADMLREAGSFLSEKLHGRTMAQMNDIISEEIKMREAQINNLMTCVVESGIATKLENGRLIVRGRSNLLEDNIDTENLEKLQTLIQQLESKETVSKLLDEASNADGVKIYIGSENSVFGGTGHSLILSPYKNGANNIVGAIGVIGPTRLNYAKIIPSVNYMTEILSRRIRSLS